MIINPLLKLILAVLLLLCLADMPYGYYNLVRFVTMATSVYFAYKEFTEGSKEMGGVFVVLALLFQPFLKIALGRTVWNVVDVVVALFLVFMVVKKQKENRKMY